MRKLRPPLTVSILVVFAAIVGSLQLMSSATQDNSQLNRLYSLLLLINSLGSVLLFGLVVTNVYWLLLQLKKRVAGSRLTARMVFLFILLSMSPASIVFYYSMQFLQQSIDSWFDVRIDKAMEDALELGQAALDERMRNLLRQTEQAATHLENVPNSMLAITLSDVYDIPEEAELTVFSRQGHILASSGPNPLSIVPNLPGEGILLQLRRGRSYVGLEPDAGEGLKVRALVAVAAGEDNIFLQALYPTPLRLSKLAHTVEEAFMQHKELNYLRSSLKASFALTLSLVLLLSLLAATWGAFASIRRIVDPVRRLVQGTRAVAEGDYEKRLPVKSRDELGFLAESFNAMTARLSRARDDAQNHRLEVERHRAYLETLLENLSSGILSFDSRMRLQTANHAADAILHANLSGQMQITLPELMEQEPHLAQWLSRTGDQLLKEKAWHEETSFHGPEGRQELLCRGTPLFDGDGQWQGAVLVIDDVTALLKAQRKAAWGEVAQRLAHEIKNPLTPIQLSAERLQHKLAKTLSESDAEVLEKSTRTIVQQVEAMKSMVNAFAEYAKPAAAHLRPVDISALIEEVATLYPPKSGLEIELNLDRQLPHINADPVRLRQVLHNLIKNAQEAMEGKGVGPLFFVTRLARDQLHQNLEILIRDQGPGIPADQAEQVFEPYVTNKSKGTGLGLAIVKKIIEEHGGSIRLDSTYTQGAGFIIRLPVADNAGASA